MIDDNSRFLPNNTYGTTKAVAEMMVNEYTRKGFVDGRTVRYPTIIVRPGTPNTAVTGIFSGLIREPLNGEPCEVVVDPTLGHACASYWAAVSFTIAVHELPTNAVPLNDRTLQLAGLCVTLEELRSCLEALARAESLLLPEITVNIDEELSRMVSGMPCEAECRRSRELGLPRDRCVEEIVWNYYYDYVKCSDETYQRPPIGFVGLGNMGAPMATNLGRTGYPVVLYNRTKAKAKMLARPGQDMVASSLKEVMDKAKIVCTCLPNEAEIDAVLLADGGLVDNLTPGSILIDHSTVCPATSMRCHAACLAKGASFLDAPISGGPEGARNASLSIMVGGDPLVFEQAKPVLKAMGANVVLMGGPGAGTATKLINQNLVASHNMAACENMLLARRLGLKNMTQLLSLLKESWGASKILERSGGKVAVAEAKGLPSSLNMSGAPLRNLSKDINIVAGVLEGLELNLPSVKVSSNALDAAMDKGLDNADMAVLYYLLQDGTIPAPTEIKMPIRKEVVQLPLQPAHSPFAGPLDKVPPSPPHRWQR